MGTRTFTLHTCVRICHTPRMSKRMGRPPQSTCHRGHRYRISPSGRKWCPECQNAAARARRSPRVVRPLYERAWEKVDIRSPQECWPWTASVNQNMPYGGYGQISKGPGGGMLRAHRVIYESMNGPIPEGYVIDHTCHNDSGCEGRGPECPHRRCCNPDHLEAVVPAENLERGYHRGASRG